MVPSLPLLSCESPVSAKENPDRKKKKTVKKYVVYTTNQGRNRRGRPRATYVKLMEKVIGMDKSLLDSVNRKLGRVGKDL